MKISVVLEKKSRFNIDLPEGEAKNLYKSLIGSIVNALKVQTQIVRTQPTVKDTELKEINIEEKATTIKDSEEKVEEVPRDEEVKVIEPNQMRISKKLVMLKCAGCSETLVSVVSEGQWSLTCKSCRTNNTVENLKAATYICPNCEYKANFYVKDGLDIVKCKNCDGGIDLIYHEKKEKYLSANLIK